jgi:uncharacterized membrane protein required for colicin V production
MPNQTDLIIFVCFAAFFFIGWRKGFIRTIFGPLSLIIASVASYLYFHKSHDLITSLIIGIIGPFVLNFALGLVIKINQSDDKKKDPLPVGKWVGGFLNMFWEGSLVLLTVVLIAFLPSIPGITKIKNNVTQSKTYSLLKKVIDKKLPASATDIESIIKIAEDPKVAQAVQDSKEYKDLMADYRIKRLFADEAVMEQIKNRDIGRLITNKALQEIMQDPKLIEKFITVNKEILKQQPKE